MIQQTQVQTTYNDLYEQLRNYLWPITTVEVLAQLEIECYTAFPDLDKIEQLFHSLKLDIAPAAEEDEDLKKAIDEFDKLLSDKQPIFIKIPVPMEVKPT